MLLEIAVVYAVACWIMILGFLAYGLILYGTETKWTWRIVARITLIVIAAPISVPAAAVFILSASRFSYRNHGN